MSNVSGTSETRSARSATFATCTPERFATLNVQAALAPIVVGLGVTSIPAARSALIGGGAGGGGAGVGAGAGGGGFFAFTKSWKLCTAVSPLTDAVTFTECVPASPASGRPEISSLPSNVSQSGSRGAA